MKNVLTRTVLALAPAAFMPVLAGTAAAYPRPGTTERVSVSSEGVQANSFSINLAISADGRYVAFASAASNLVPMDTNGRTDVFVHDRQTGTTERVSVASDGAEANGYSIGPAISADGRHVAYWSFASNLVPGDTNLGGDMFVHDRQTGTTERVSVASGGAEANASDALTPAISADGRYVVFVSDDFTLVPGDTNGERDVFVHDRFTGNTERVNVASDGAQADPSVFGSFEPAISADGRYVAFVSYASNLVPGDTNECPNAPSCSDVFVHDRFTGITERVSVSSDGAEADFNSYVPTVSADGRHVAFQSFASNLVPADTNDDCLFDPNCPDVFVHDRETGATERVSVSSSGAEADAGSYIPMISADGRYVAFQSTATNLVPGDTNVGADVFVHDRETGATERVSVSSDGAQANSSFGSSNPAISADGRHVAFFANANNLVPGDTNGVPDEFVRDRGPAVGVGTLAATCDGGSASVSGWATLSGGVIASADDLANDGASGAADAGGELTGASLAYRPEDGDLMVRLRVASLPPPLAGAPGVLYGFQLTVGADRYEVRAARAAATPGDPAAPYFGLYRCDALCTEVAPLAGGMGTTGLEVVAAVPLSALGASEGVSLTGLAAYAAFGDATTGPGAPLDDVTVPTGILPVHSVSLGIAAAGTPEAEVFFDMPASLVDGVFSGTLPPVAAGDYDVWARACLGNACGAASAPATCTGAVGVEAGSFTLTLRGAHPNPFRAATRLSYALPAAGRVSIRIVDVRGRQVERPVEARQEVGEHEFVWNARTRPSGLYFAIISSGGVTRAERLVLLR